MIDEPRQCKKCGVIKPLSEFKPTRNTFEYCCRICSRALCRKWWAENQDKVKRYKEDNRERDRIQRKKWYQENRPRLLENTRQWRKKNMEHRAAYMRSLQKERPEIFADAAARRRANQKNATPAWSNKFFISEAYDLAKIRTKALGYKWHVDHIVPLQNDLVCGLHVEHNLQVIPASHNQSKNNRVWPDMP